MRAEKWGELSYEAFALRRILEALPSNLPSIRDAQIQCGKLDRMLTDENKQSRVIDEGTRALGGGSIKKWKKKQAKRAKLVGQQIRTVRALSDKVFKESLRKGNPQLSNAEFRDWRMKFDSALSQSKRKFIKDLMERVASRLASGHGFERVSPPRRLTRNLNDILLHINFHFIKDFGGRDRVRTCDPLLANQG